MYKIRSSEQVKTMFRYLFKKDKTKYTYLKKKIEQICNYPTLGKPLKNVLKGTRRVHIGELVLIYEIDDINNLISLICLKHHDEVYK
ncbi:MAG: type II toxin-antitoxin system mRNA interferase toxin, RelE/StbE family [Candidatus ainarchaeum sp.]|nr:type II toxin-antitoxin system mRNA interferase toxin, RelE/StbE family [Candidatus ainarchaeum sp.]